MENKNYSNETSMVELPKRPFYAGENKKSGGEGYALDEPLMGEVNLKIFLYPLLKTEMKYRIFLNNPQVIIVVRSRQRRGEGVN